MTDERIALIRELAEKATPGPWEAEEMLHHGAPGTGFTQAIWANDSNVPVEELGNLSWADGQFIAAARTAIPELLTLLDVQKKRIEQLECSVPSPTGEAALLREAAMKEKLRADDAEARASRAEQATVKADLARNAAEVERGLLRAAISTERERVIQECARIAESMKEWNHGVADIVAQRIRALSSLPTPPLQTQKWIPCSEQLPELDEPVEIFMPKNRTQKRAIASRNHNGGTSDNYEWHWWYECGYTDVAKNRVTHWQPLPTPPEEAKA